ncbi:MAG: hypothetical protein PHY11_00750 [Bacilli bacterium]|nr:hypothetical protein [Bacilli bacterium]MDD4065509.1 hypothetical protein [Bacilli bacterium]
MKHQRFKNWWQKLTTTQKAYLSSFTLVLALIILLIIVFINLA